ncbi:hypothetical protein ACFYYB_08805 [Streptomyces sp. NPDC002886]|uniref:hypothetical protein n=1 Tax=Streptomyces sp. NPDC002886 TaxID=3364667 RepID=UPI00369F9D52
MRKRALARGLGVGFGMALAVSLNITPASAAWGLQLNDWGAGAVSDDRYGVSACDGKADNRGIRTEYVTSNGGFDHVGDANGSAGGCGSERSFDGYPISAFRVCARNSSTGQDLGCTNWGWI